MIAGFLYGAIGEFRIPADGPAFPDTAGCGGNRQRGKQATASTDYALAARLLGHAMTRTRPKIGTRVRPIGNRQGAARS